MTKIKCFFLIIFFLSFLGCAGTGGNNRVVFSRVMYPVSLSAKVPAQNGKIMGIEQLERKGTFYSKQSGWALMWGLIPVSPIDFSDSVNTQIKQANGDAILNLSIKANQCGSNGFFILNWFPLWPGKVDVEATGTIVKKDYKYHKEPPVSKY